MEGLRVQNENKNITCIFLAVNEFSIKYIASHFCLRRSNMLYAASNRKAKLHYIINLTV